MLKNVVNNFENFHSGDVPAGGPNSKKFYDDLKKIAGLDQLFSSEPLSRDFKLKYRRNYKNKNA
ncbi:hypothetical protein D3C86_2220020 [compost metagenome]